MLLPHVRQIDRVRTPPCRPHSPIRPTFGLVNVRVRVRVPVAISPGTVETYRRQLSNHVLPALGEVRLGEATAPLVDKVIGAIRSDVSPATAKSCRSVISGVLSLAVRYGAIAANPVR